MSRARAAHVLLVVVAAPGQSPTASELRAYLSTRLVRWWMPDAIELIEALPLGATGKVLKRRLRERFAGYVFPE
jgi:fatty-acyl-CoA synthase